MKKVLAALMSIFCMLAACGCVKTENTPPVSGSDSDKVFAGEVTYSTSASAEIRGLDNTYHRLTADKELNIVYMGGSVTVGYGSTKGCWRTFVSEWFEQTYPQAQINSHTAAIGQTGSTWALARLERDVFPKNPDLVFIEYSVNDKYDGRSYAQSVIYVDGLVREIGKKFPNCDVVIVSVCDSGTIKEKSPNRDAHRAVAEYNGVEYIDVAPALTEALSKNGNDWSHFLIDIVHPNENGYRVYADYIIEKITEAFTKAKAKNAGLQANKLPEKPLSSMTPLSVKTIFSADIDCDKEMWRTGGELKNGMNSGRTIKGKKGAEIEMEFEGNTVVVVGQFFAGNVVEFTIDGKEKVIFGREDAIGALPVFENLVYGKHTLKVECLGDSCSIAAIMFG